MKLISYNKLVRDRIPEIIAAAGKTCTTEILSHEDYLRMIDSWKKHKLQEYTQLPGFVQKPGNSRTSSGRASAEA